MFNKIIRSCGKMRAAHGNRLGQPARNRLGQPARESALGKGFFSFFIFWVYTRYRNTRWTKLFKLTRYSRRIPDFRETAGSTPTKSRHGYVFLYKCTYIYIYSYMSAKKTPFNFHPINLNFVCQNISCSTIAWNVVTPNN